MKNKKGMHLSLNAVILIALALLVSATVLFLFFGGFRSAARGSEKVSGEAKEEAEGLDILSLITGAGTGSICEGTPTETRCSYYYDESYASSGEVGYSLHSNIENSGLQPINSEVGSSIPLPNCGLINGYALHQWGGQRMWWYGNESNHFRCINFNFKGLGTCARLSSKRIGWVAKSRCPESDLEVSTGPYKIECCDCNAILNPFFFNNNLESKCDFSCYDLTKAGEEICLRVPGCTWTS